jgi:hypothetical protein
MITPLAQFTPEGLIAGDTPIAFAVILLVLLLALLVEREILRCSVEPRARLGVKTLQIAIAPLLIAFAVIVIARFSTLLRS